MVGNFEDLHHHVINDHDPTSSVCIVDQSVCISIHKCLVKVYKIKNQYKKTNSKKNLN